jgi:aminopeptidase N
MAYTCIDSIKDQVTTIPKYTTGWLGGLSRAVNGFREDQMSTTHPVRSVMPNTGLARMYFDGITYRKGMMTLKQLVFLMGADNFFKGVTNYFNNFGWSNGTIDDFISAIEPYFSSPAPEYTLDVWKTTWLLTPSLNILTIDWDPQALEVNAKLTIKQTYFTEDYPTLRYHKINLAFFLEDGTYTIQEVFVKNTEQTEVTYDASAGVKAILVN